MITVNITDFRANLLTYLNKAQHGEQITVTSNGHLLATVIAPIDQKRMAQRKLESLAKTAKINDVLSPIGDQWESMG
jgi:prevent-host-death family protein